MLRCDELGSITDEPGRLTRTFHSPAMARANALVGGWMESTGLEVREDAAFNLVGRWPSGASSRARTLLLGSHLDTVRDAGRYDGALGVLTALAAVDALRLSGAVLPFHVEVIGFSDEEGVRYQSTYLGSRALAGTLRPRDLRAIEEKGIEQAKRRKRDLLAYAEVHIEQGPVLEAGRVGLGVVTGIAGQTRVHLEFTGRAGHAGTTPMTLRRDALCAAAEFILAVENAGLTATVGRIEAQPGASNVIPAHVTLSLDVRHPADTERRAGVARLRARALAIAKKRRTPLQWIVRQETNSIACDPRLTELMERAAQVFEPTAPTLASGAGHDAAALAAVCPVAMLFVRCKGGLSHHPAESIRAADATKAIGALREFILRLADEVLAP